MSEHLDDPNTLWSPGLQRGGSAMKLAGCFNATKTSSMSYSHVMTPLGAHLCWIYLPSRSLGMMHDSRILLPVGMA